MGAGLLAKASVQQTLMLADPPLSRASPLPQGYARSIDQVGCQAAIGGKPPPSLNGAQPSPPIANQYHLRTSPPFALIATNSYLRQFFCAGWILCRPPSPTSTAPTTAGCSACCADA
ncbi:hypothetical protein FRT59_20440 [Pseudomonas haemolytica]|uniref:Uncharacterized protein n=1 Tax=Pseudomonas haemolytica TaxID=2600065 RepID=A0A5P1DFP5_9PSED|nr:hypothetical protein [Pseudomonas haemolytica]